MKIAKVKTFLIRLFLFVTLYGVLLTVSAFKLSRHQLNCGDLGACRCAVINDVTYYGKCNSVIKINLE